MEKRFNPFSAKGKTPWNPRGKEGGFPQVFHVSPLLGRLGRVLKTRFWPSEKQLFKFCGKENNELIKIAKSVCYRVCYWFCIFPWLCKTVPKIKKKPQYLVVFFGAVSGIWTRDLVLTKDVLYLLSHNSILNFAPIFKGFRLPRFTAVILPAQSWKSLTMPQR